MRLVSVLVPTYNEEANIAHVYEAVVRVMATHLAQYRFELVFIDNCSNDRTRDLIADLCQKDERVKAIFNARNFGYSRSHFYGLTQMEGDCVILIHADLQNPPELIPDFIAEWEKGQKVVIGIKDRSLENPVLFFLRTIYYKTMKVISDVEQIEHFTDFELLDRSFVDVLRKIDDPMPYLRGIVSEMGFKISRIHYVQNKRERGKSYANFFRMYDFAMLGITSYSKSLLRLATFFGVAISILSLAVAAVIFIQKLLDWERYPIGQAAMGVGIFFLGGVQLFFIGIMGEYVLAMNSRILRRPLVIEETRLNMHVRGVPERLEAG